MMYFITHYSLLITQVRGHRIPIREYSFLDNPRTPKAIRNGALAVKPGGGMGQAGARGGAAKFSPSVSSLGWGGRRGRGRRGRAGRGRAWWAKFCSTVSPAAASREVCGDRMILWISISSSSVTSTNPPSLPTNPRQDNSLELPANLSDSALVKLLDPYRRKYRRIHFASPVVQALSRFEDPTIKLEFDWVSLNQSTARSRSRSSYSAGNEINRIK